MSVASSNKIKPSSVAPPASDKGSVVGSQISAANSKNGAKKLEGSVKGSNASTVSTASKASGLTTTTVLRSRIERMEYELSIEKKAREDANKQLQTTMQELELVERVLKLRNTMPAPRVE
eukprot:PhF_6_TR11163/c0_g1_i1/m.17996